MIILKSKKEIELMREAGRIVHLAHQELKKAIEPGITTKELDQIADRFIHKMGATPSFKGYNGFAGSICTSINNELVHGIPSSRKLKQGDIISLDIGACFEGYHGDSAWTYPVGEVSSEAQRLLEVSEDALMQGLQKVRAGARLGDVSNRVQEVAESAGFSIVREYVGHGIGQDLHEPPSIPNYGTAGKGLRLKAGMTLAIEPMINQGKRFVRTLEDNWTVVTVDGSLCAHFEHTVAVTDEGCEILTIS